MDIRILLIPATALCALIAHAQTAISLDAKPVEGLLAAGKTDEYRLTVKAGQFVHLAVDQIGVDVRLTITDPVGGTVDSVDKRATGVEEFDLNAKVAGDYRVAIESVRSGAVEGKYSLAARTAIRYVMDRTQANLASPRLNKLCDDLVTDRSAEAAFLAERKGKGPLVEPVDGDSRLVRVSFVLAGDASISAVDLIGGPVVNGFTAMSRIPTTGLWTVTITTAKDSRFAYIFQVTNEKALGALDPKPNLPQKGIRLDSLNPSRSSNGQSMLVLENAPKRPFADVAASPGVKGVVTSGTIDSAILKEKRGYSVYTPHGYDPARPGRYGLLVVFDGEAYMSLVPTATILDNLIAAGKIPPMVAILVNSHTTRNRDLTCSKAFSDFLATELLPAVKAKYPGIEKKASRVIVAGCSFGGLCSGYCGLAHPETFGNVLSQSGSYWVNGNDWQKQDQDMPPAEGFVQAGFMKSKKLPVRFFIEVGTYEDGARQLMTNRQLRDILLAKGYDVTYSEFNGNHDFEHWRGSLADGLIALTRDWR